MTFQVGLFPHCSLSRLLTHYVSATHSVLSLVPGVGDSMVDKTDAVSGLFPVLFPSQALSWDSLSVALT